MHKKKIRILIIRCGLLGDTIDSTAVIKPLKENYGNNLEIDWVTKSNLNDLFRFDNNVNPIFIKYTKLPFLLNLDKLKIIFKSYIKPYDILLNLEVGSKFNSISRLTKSSIKIGMPYKYIADNIKGEHRVEHQLRILQLLIKNINKDNAYPYLIGSDVNIESKFDIKNQYIVICPTNSKFKKKNYRGYRAWPLENWKNLIQLVIEKTDLNIVITGGDNERDFINMLKPFNERINNICGQTSIPDLCEIMKRSECVIANDSGSAHVAGACAKKVIALHGPTDYRQSGPYGNKNNKIIIASLNLSCSPCYNTESIKNCKENICLKNLSPMAVFNYMVG